MSKNMFNPESNENVLGWAPENLPELGFLQHLNLAIWHSILRIIQIFEMKDLPFNEETIILL